MKSKNITLHIKILILIVVCDILIFLTDTKEICIARNYTAFSLNVLGVEDDDMVITSDADEIINPLILENTDWFDPNNLYAAMQRAFYYDLNTHYQDDWRGSRVCTWGKMKDLSVDKLRDSMWEESHRLLDGGWHWSYFGGVERYRQK